MLTIKDSEPSQYFRTYATMFGMGSVIKLPDIETVRKEAAQIKNVERDWERAPPLCLSHGNFTKMPRSMYYLSQIPDLFTFAIHCYGDDVPSDLVAPCIWALEHVLRGAEEGTEELLEQAGLMAGLGPDKMHVLLGNILNAQMKVSKHYLNPIINLPEKAVVHLRAVVEDEIKRSGDSPALLFEFAMALARTGKDDAEAKEVLTSLHNDLQSGKLEGAKLFIASKVYLARVLRRLEPENPLIKTLQNELIRWFKKNPFGFSESRLKELFLTDINAKSDPVFLALGGEIWLRKRKDTAKTDERLTRSCFYCSAREPQVKVSQCSRCKHIYYCSRKCQIAHFPFHKEACKDEAAALKRAEELELSISAPAEGHCASDWITWRHQKRPNINIARALALGLDHNPSRSRTHMLLEAVVHVPDAKDPRDRFQVAKAGVYKMDDVWSEIDKLTGTRSNPGEGKKMIDEMLIETTEKDGIKSLPIFCFQFGLFQHVEPFLACSSVLRFQLGEYIVRNPGNRNWRKMMNSKGPEPTHIQLPGREIRDAEFIFD